MRRHVLLAALGITAAGAALLVIAPLSEALATHRHVYGPDDEGRFLLAFGLVVFTLELAGLVEPIAALLSAPIRRWAGLPPLGDPEKATSPAVT